MSVFIYLIKTRLNFTSSFLDQNNLKSKNELIYIKDFKVVQAIRSRVFKPDKTLLLVFLNSTQFMPFKSTNREYAQRTVIPSIKYFG